MKSQYAAMGDLHNAELPTRVLYISLYLVWSPTQTLPDRSKTYEQNYTSRSHHSDTYIATLHRQGVRLYGGPSFQLQARFFHPLVPFVTFRLASNTS
jgi:hypothetical protein